MSRIKAIETIYKGYRFRSRLEARWAVFFDALEMNWVYEPEGFELSSGERYLPDFWVPIEPEPSLTYQNPGYWVEIKPAPLTPEEHEKCRLLAIESGHQVCILAGQPWPGEFFQQKWCRDGRFVCFTTQHNRDLDHWSRDYMNTVISYPCSASGCNFKWGEAYAAARAARFEYGETPRPNSIPILRAI